MQDGKIASNRKRAVTRTKVAAWVIAGMVMIAGGIIVVVLTRNSQPPGAVAQGQQPITDQSTTTPQADTAATETLPPAQQSAAADDHPSDEEVVHTEPAENPQTEALPPASSQMCAEVARADRILRAAGWGFERFSSWDDYLPGEYTVLYSRPVEGRRKVKLLAQLMGDDSRLISLALNGYVGSISSAAEHAERKREAWTLFIKTAKALIPDAEPAIAESRAAAEDKGMRTEGEAATLSSWRVSTRDYEYLYMGRPPLEGDWLLVLHISRD